MLTKNHRLLMTVLSMTLLLIGGVEVFAQADAKVPGEASKPAEPPKPVVAAMPKARDVKIAVIDVEKTFNTLDERGQVQADLAVMAEKYAQESNAMNDEIKDMEKDLGFLEFSSPQYAAKEAALSKKAYEKQAWLTWRQGTMQREQKLRQLDLYKKIIMAAADLAKENGYDLVLYKETDIQTMARMNPQEQQDAMAQRKLIFFAPDLEITDALITRMNNEYRNRRGAAKTAAPAPAPAPK